MVNRVPRLALALAATALAALWGAGATRPGAVPAGSAFVATTGSDSNPCTQAAPCLSFDRAYHVAKPGQVVAVAAGSYSAQTITADPAKSAPAVVFKPQGFDAVQVANLTIQGSYVEFDDLKIAGIWYVGVNSNKVPQASQTHDVVLRNLSALRFFITGASNVSVLGGTIGPTVDNASQIKGCYECRYAPQNITVDGVTFHDFTRTNPAQHMECLHVYPAQNLTIRNSRFFNCAIMDLFLENYGRGGDLRDITIENNVFDTPGSHAGSLSKGYYALAFEGVKRSITNVRIAYNSMLTGSIPGFDSSSSYAGVVVEANVGALNPRFCVKGVTYAYNVWTEANCGATDATAPSDFADPAHFDFHLRPTAAAIGHGNPTRHPPTDIDGRLRPSRSASDAGAYQRETALMVLGKSIGSAAIGQHESAVVGFYGQPLRSQAVRVGGRLLRQLIFNVPGGTLWVATNGRIVLGVGTSSPYYQTTGAVRATAGIRRVRTWLGVKWIGCRHAYRRYFQGVPVYFAPKGGRSGDTIGSISMMKGDGACS
jgi:hypothetical protein